MLDENDPRIREDMSYADRYILSQLHELTKIMQQTDTNLFLSDQVVLNVVNDINSRLFALELIVNNLNKG